MSRLNLGCGQTPTHGWKNYDNSWSVRMARLPGLTALASRLGLLTEEQQGFAEVVRDSGIVWANVTRRIPELDASVEVIYSSHMVEHLDRDQAMGFLAEARRVLRPGGVIRIAVPDIRYHVDRYLEHQDAERFIDGIFVTQPRPVGVVAKFKYLCVGNRHHQRMYDGASLCRLLLEAGFQTPEVMNPGTTRIEDPGPLDLAERVPESVFVEAIRP